MVLVGKVGKKMTTASTYRPRLLTNYLGGWRDCIILQRKQQGKMTNEAREPQLALFPNSEDAKKPDLSSTFADNMSLPIHRWFRYTAGFSAAWVRAVIEAENGKNVLDPFGGSGTVMIESEFSGVNSIGIEAHPYVYRIANAKLAWHNDPQEFRKSARQLLETAKSKKVKLEAIPDLIEKCYPADTISKLEALKQAWLESKDRNDIKELNWFVIMPTIMTTRMRPDWK